MSTVKKGKEGEKLASGFLQEQGYEIVELNYRYRRGELDIVARKEGVLVFVEVKMKKSQKFGYPEEAVNAKKEEMIITTADNYIYEKNWMGSIRFDIISILDKPEGPEISHFTDAFY